MSDVMAGVLCLTCCHDYDRAWFVSDVMARVSMLNMLP
jgi:hypothetical protein